MPITPTIITIVITPMTSLITGDLLFLCQSKHVSLYLDSFSSSTNADTESVLSSSIRSINTRDALDTTSLTTVDTAPGSNFTANSDPSPPKTTTDGAAFSRRSVKIASDVPTPFGELQVQLKHCEDEQQIVVKILRAKNLIARDANGFSDPYVKCYLLPGRE